MPVVTTLADFEKLIDRRVAEAKLLLGSGEWDGAYYLIGYAVEYALKVVIIKNMITADCFPDKPLTEIYFGHNLERLKKAAGLETEMKNDENIEPIWSTVANWSEQTRYLLGKSEAVAQELFDNVVFKVLPWIRARW